MFFKTLVRYLTMIEVVKYSDSIVEHRVLDTRKFCRHFEDSNFRVIGPSNRVLVYCYLNLIYHRGNPGILLLF
jgi:hypothetical protein